MRDLIQKHWINALGLSFVFTAFLYFLKLAVENNWLPLEVRIASGVLLGISGVYSGYFYYQQKRFMLGETLAGIGMAILYSTIGYLSFSPEIQWSTGALMLSIIAVSSLVSYVAVKMDMRILFLISMIGALITPFVIRASFNQDIPLFIYLLVVNVTAIGVSISKKWTEMKVISFVMSLGLYATYYALFEPEQWGKPFFYVASIFLVYIVGLIISSAHEKNYNGINLYLGVVNAINFVFWCNLIFREFALPHTVPLLIVGIIFIILGWVIYYLSGKTVSMAFGSYTIVGILVMAIATSDLSQLYYENGMHHVISSAIWLVIIGITYAAGRFLQQSKIAYIAMVAYVFLIGYWYSVAWSVEWVEMFGIRYIPFLNAGAFVWMAMAFLGFSLATFAENDPQNRMPIGRTSLATIMAIISHIVVGGLLTVQIMNLWDAYNIPFISKDLSLSVCWFTYALILFAWGNKSGNVFFRGLGGFVLLFSSCKVFFYDLDGETSFQKILFLLAIGGVTFIIGKISQKEVEPVVIEPAAEEPPALTTDDVQSGVEPTAETE